MPFLPTNWNATPRKTLFASKTSTDETLSLRRSEKTVSNDRPHLPASEPSLMSLKQRPRLTLNIGETKTGQCEDFKHASPSRSTRTNTSGIKKKGSDVFGFLSLKEPSTAAWEDFAKKQQKQAAQKGGRLTAVGMPGVSSQKLPSHVPRVNSRWDGLPESTRAKGSHQRQRDGSSSNSTLSSEPQRSGLSLVSCQGSGSSTTGRSSSQSSRSTDKLLNSSARRHDSLREWASSHQDVEVFVHSDRSGPQKHRVSTGMPSSSQDVAPVTFFLPPSPLALPLCHPDEHLVQYHQQHQHTTLVSPLTFFEASIHTRQPEHGVTAIATPRIASRHPDSPSQEQRSDDEIGTFWVSDSEDGVPDAISSDVMKAPNYMNGSEPNALGATSFSSGTFYIHEDHDSSEFSDSKLPKYQSRTSSSSSGLSKSSSISTESTSLFSINPSLASTPSTEASSMIFHPESSIVPCSGKVPLPPATGIPSQKRGLSKARPSPREMVKKAEVLPWEMCEAPA